MVKAVFLRVAENKQGPGYETTLWVQNYVPEGATITVDFSSLFLKIVYHSISVYANNSQAVRFNSLSKQCLANLSETKHIANLHRQIMYMYMSTLQ